MARLSTMASPGISRGPAICEKRLVQSIAGVDFLHALVDAHLNPVAVELDFMKPLLTLRSLGLQGGELLALERWSLIPKECGMWLNGRAGADAGDTNIATWIRDQRLAHKPTQADSQKN